ncbi:MAG TPA: aminoglycoside phosphotransferase family protein [Dehalococcoidia bacterium]|nr:aminoglycoside phosphotransferase family protein [Dehalococcoidia bacterium]
MPGAHPSIPDALVATTRDERGESGMEWLRRLPRIIRTCARAWALDVGPPFDGLSYNYVAPARRADGSAAVLKVCFPEPEFFSETEALRLFDGRASVRLLESDVDRCALLVERIRPGRPVSVLRDDVAETAAAAAVMRGLWRPPPASHAFPLARDWLSAARDAKTLPATKAAYPWIEGLLERAAHLASDGAPLMLLHGDLHHDNIISAERAPWLAIDPKGVVGEPAWEIAPFLFNNLPAGTGEARRLIRRRADQLSDELSLDRARVYAWSAVRSLQSAFWSLRDSVRLREIAVMCAEELARGP